MQRLTAAHAEHTGNSLGFSAISAVDVISSPAVKATTTLEEPMHFVSRVMLTTAIAVFFAAAGGAQGRGADGSAQDLAQALQRKYDGIRDFSAEFTHTYRGGVLKKEIVERGRLLVKKPGKMRWQYTAPEQKLFVSDGVKMYSYIPQDKQVIVSSIPPDDQITTPTMFLAGKGNLARDFSASIVEPPSGAAAGSRALKLVPKSPQREYDWLLLTMAPQTLELRGLVTSDAQGGLSSFTFANLKENTGVADKEFAFKIPRGVDVVSDSSTR
jgi:outer membrane lipoprotein carrier protein